MHDHSENVRFFLKGDLLEGYSEFGEMRRIYADLPEEMARDWSWRGTRRFLSACVDYNPDHCKLLLKILEALEKDRNDGIKILVAADDQWRTLIRQSRNWKLAH